jgi:hypothetical protein
LKRRTIVLGTRPSGEIERSVRIDPGFSQHRVAKDRRDFGVGPHILQERLLNLLTQAPVTKKLPAVEAAQRSAEFCELLQTLDSDSLRESLGLSHAQRVDDDRRIARPVKEIVWVGIIGGWDRRRQDRSWPWNDALSKPGAILDQIGSRDSAQPRACGEARFFVYPVVERSHDPAKSK